MVSRACRVCAGMHGAAATRLLSSGPALLLLLLSAILKRKPQLVLI